MVQKFDTTVQNLTGMLHTGGNLSTPHKKKE
jgi:hypothetical protein